MKDLQTQIDEALRTFPLPSERVTALSLLSIAQDLRRIVNTQTTPAEVDLRQLNPLLRKIATASTCDPGETDLDDEQPVGLSITLGDVRRARRLLG